MGLDVTAYKNLTRIDCVFNASGEEIAYYFRAHVNPDFDGRQDTIEDQACYRYEARYQFAAGSYSGYSQWREELAKLAGYPEIEYERWGQKEPSHAASTYDRTEGPFWELINFSDCEGVIGPKTSEKLAKDFADHQAKADAHDDEWFPRLYAKWRAAFEMAAQNGAVRFH